MYERNRTVFLGNLPFDVEVSHLEFTSPRHVHLYDLVDVGIVYKP